jgi:FixJ family two-component response regulator
MGSKGLVVVVDDDERILRSLGSLLESVGFAVVVFSSAEAFLESGRAKDAACVVSDVGMPGMSGAALQRFLCSEYPQLPVILISGRLEAAVLDHVDVNDPLRFFEKPFNGKQLVRAITALSGRPAKGDPQIPGA